MRRFALPIALAASMASSACLQSSSDEAATAQPPAPSAVTTSEGAPGAGLAPALTPSTSTSTRAATLAPLKRRLAVVIQHQEGCSRGGSNSTTRGELVIDIARDGAATLALRGTQDSVGWSYYEGERRTFHTPDEQVEQIFGGHARAEGSGVMVDFEGWSLRCDPEQVTATDGEVPRQVDALVCRIGGARSPYELVALDQVDIPFSTSPALELSSRDFGVTRLRVSDHSGEHDDLD